MKYASFFAGAGGLDHGFIKAGMEPVLITDIWKPAVDTLKKNIDSKNVVIEQKDITKIDKKYITDKLKDQKVNIVIGGPPCQAFSRLNQNQLFKDGKHKEENLNDPRRSLFMDFLRVAKYIDPEFIVMENVADLKTRKLGGSSKDKDKLVLDIIKQEFNNIDYDVIYNVVNTTDYGVPQMRKRIIFIAVRKDLGIKLKFPEKKKLETSVALELKKNKKVHPNQEKKDHSDEWISKVKCIPPGGYYNDLPVKYKVTKKTTLGLAKKQGKKDLALKKGNVLIEFNLKKHKGTYKYILDGWEYTKKDFDVLANECEIHEVMPRMGSYLRRINSSVSHTVTRNPLIHYSDNRELTIREKASIQTFDPSYEFCGTKQEQSTQVGNAVPCNLGQAIAKYILSIKVPNDK